jgi:hypothetical protein
MTATLRTIQWSARDLNEGESITGTVLRLPTPGAFNGSRLFIGMPDEVVGITATAKSGHTLLERGLRHVAVGDKITITYRGKRVTVDGERSYRHYEVERCPR